MTFEPNLGRLDHVTATNGTTFDCAHEHGSVCSDATFTNGIISTSASDRISALGTIIASVPDLASMIGCVFDSMAVTLVRTSPHPPSTDPVTLLLLIGVSAVALAAIIHIIGDRTS